MIDGHGDLAKDQIRNIMMLTNILVIHVHETDILDTDLGNALIE